ncbi:MAG: hypothetical protein M1830_007079 [Pleopsidium flavum]|nr:MAG: hypothetical protein M1830_007079 [Pleopsidium flavum]
MQNRIDRLEGLVLSLMTNGAQSAGPVAAAAALSARASTGSAEFPQDLEAEDDDMIKEEGEDAESETDQVARSFGVMRVDNNNSMYIGDAHWAAILSDIAEVKNYFHEHRKQYEDQILKVKASKSDGDFRGPAFLFGGQKPPDKSEILASIPSRHTTDNLLARYFNSYDSAIHILHPPTFYRQYEQYWREPDRTCVAWVGQLFAILTLAMVSYHRSGDEPPEFRGKVLDLTNTYRKLTAQCLVLADFTKPVTHMIETLILHLHSEFSHTKDTEVGIWVMVGMIVRLAMRMGYHRDPKPYNNISPFQGEMRRRVWSFVQQADLLFSFQIGLPSMIRLGDCDTGLPRNIYDDEFDEDTKELPPSRPRTEPTPVSYMIAKSEIAFAFGKIVEQSQSLNACSYEDIMKHDANLREVRAQYPPHLRLRSLEDSIMDPTALIMQRFSLSILYNKGQCVLHRKFLDRARGNPRYAHSRRTCIDSSMELLHHQVTLHTEYRPGGRLHSMERAGTSLTTHDFLLAAMIVCLELYYGCQEESASKSAGDLYSWGLERRTDMISALEASKNIWKEQKDQSIEAYKASKILTVMLANSQRPLKTHRQVQQPPFAFRSLNNNMDRIPALATLEEEQPEHTAAVTLGMLSGGLSPNTAAMYNGIYPTTPSGNITMGDVPPSGMTPQSSMDQNPNGVASAPSPFSAMGAGNDMMDIPSSNFDWDAWDSYIQGTSLDPANQVWPNGMDLPATTPASINDLQQQIGFTDGGGVFMGVSTPPGNTM